MDHDIQLLLDCLRRIGAPDGATTFGRVFSDEILEQQLESLVGTLKAAKKKKLVQFEGEMLLQGAHDHVEIRLMPSA